MIFRPDSPSALWSDTLTVRSTNIGSIDVNRGPRARWPRAVGYGELGLLVGAAGGALIWPLVSSSNCGTQAVAEQRGAGCAAALAFDGKKRREGALFFGAAGALIGVIAGYLDAAPRWEGISHDRFSVTIAPTSGGVGLNTTMRL
jgi:hypothetical protein